MGRMEALVVGALGRSPYDEDILCEENITESLGVLEAGQQYDGRGHPVNWKTRQRMRDHVRASNEVMQAAGIIEETSDVRARDKQIENNLRHETEVGLRSLEFGRVLLVAGVWGVGGFRRRILLYKSYSGGLLDVIRRERVQYSIPHMIGAGLPALAVYQCTEWIGLLLRAIISGPYGENKSTGKPLNDYGKFMSRIFLDYGVGYVMLNYQMFAILQQLNLISSDRLFPSLRSLIPFSPFSPLQMPPLPASFTGASTWSWAKAIVSASAPLGIVLAHVSMSTIVSSFIYAPLFRLLPKPINQQERLLAEMNETLQELEETISSHIAIDHPLVDPAQTVTSDEATSNTAPAQHAATLQALEGRSNQRDDSSDEEDNEISQQTLITFDVEATEISDATMGTWSAELRSANEPPLKETGYQITALTMLPPLLAAEGLSAVLAEVLLAPLEAVMVRTVAGAFLKSAGLGSQEIYTRYAFPSRTWGSIIAAHAVELLVTGVLWAAFTAGSQAMSEKHVLWRRMEEVEKEEEVLLQST